jgi:hypothetical protein
LRANRKQRVSATKRADIRRKAARISGDSIMRNLIRIAALLALLSSRTTMAQTIGSAASSLTQNTRLIGGAPVDHPQPHASNIPSQNAIDIERIGEEDAAVDRKLNICRGC